MRKSTEQMYRQELTTALDGEYTTEAIEVMVKALMEWEEGIEKTNTIMNNIRENAMELGDMFVDTSDSAVEVVQDILEQFNAKLDKKDTKELLFKIRESVCITISSWATKRIK